MKIDSLLKALKQTRDKKLRAQIAEEYPADWEMESIFRKSYQKYLQAEKRAEEQPRVFLKVSCRIIGTAACLLFVIGACLMMDFPQQRLPSVRNETTSSTSETTAVSVQSTVSETDDIMTSSASPTEHTETMTVSAMTTAATEPQVQLPIIHTTAVMVPEPTEPAETIVSEYPATTVPETVMTGYTEPPPTDCGTEPTNPLLPDTTETTETVVISYDLLPGFEVRMEDDFCRITYCEAVTPSPDELLEYTMDSEIFTLYSLDQKKSSCSYEIQIPGESRLLTIHQFERTEFSRGCGGDVTLLSETVNGNPAYWVLPEDDSPESANCSLIWDDGQYTFLIEERYQYKALLLPIAEALRMQN